MFNCAVCAATFAREDNVSVHVQSVHGVRKFERDVTTQMNGLNLSNDAPAGTLNRKNLTKHAKINVRRGSVIHYASRVSAVSAPSVPPVIMPTVPAPTDMWDDTVGDDDFLGVDLDFENPGEKTNYYYFPNIDKMILGRYLLVIFFPSHPPHPEILLYFVASNNTMAHILS